MIQYSLSNFPVALIMRYFIMDERNPMDGLISGEASYCTLA